MFSPFAQLGLTVKALEKVGLHFVRAQFVKYVLVCVGKPCDCSVRDRPWPGRKNEPATLAAFVYGLQRVPSRRRVCRINVLHKILIRQFIKAVKQRNQPAKLEKLIKSRTR
jgi:hypothetical protein